MYSKNIGNVGIYRKEYKNIGKRIWKKFCIKLTFAYSCMQHCLLI